MFYDNSAIVQKRAFSRAKAAKAVMPAKKPVCTLIPSAAPVLPVGVVLVSELVVEPTLYVLVVPAGVLMVGELDELVAPLDEEGAVMLNWVD